MFKCFTFINMLITCLSPHLFISTPVQNLMEERFDFYVTCKRAQVHTGVGQEARTDTGE